MCLFHKMTLLHCTNLDLGHLLSAIAALKVNDEICHQGQGVQPAKKDSGIGGHPCKRQAPAILSPNAACGETAILRAPFEAPQDLCPRRWSSGWHLPQPSWQPSHKNTLDIICLSVANRRH